MRGSCTAEVNPGRYERVPIIATMKLLVSLSWAEVFILKVKGITTELETRLVIRDYRFYIGQQAMLPG